MTDVFRAEVTLKVLCRLSLMCIFALLLTVSPPVQADSWIPPGTEDYFSADNVFMFRVVPRELSSSFGYFRDRVEGREIPGQRPGGQLYCLGIFAKRDSGDLYQTVWTKPLRNDVAPVSVLVSAAGDYVVTFDNWHAMGHGKNVVVIYGPRGKFVREFGLADFISPSELVKLPRSVSSIWWGEGHSFDKTGEYLVLRIVANGIMPYDENAVFRRVHIELATGKILAD